MCGITAFIGHKETENLDQRRKHFLELSKRIRHRGPDWNGIYIDSDNNVLITHERLAIVGVDQGSQPIVNKKYNYVLSVNGEIYNYRELYETVLHNKYQPETHSDCEVIIYLYHEFGDKCVKMLDGIFSFVLYDINNKKILVSRDPIGITSCYIGTTNKKELMISSEMKVLDTDCQDIQSFPPGHSLLINVDKSSNVIDYQYQKHFDPLWDSPHIEDYDYEDIITTKIRESLTRSVEKRLMCDVPFGVLLSGGLDSSLVASITSRLIKNKKNMWGSELHTFSIGLEGAPDLKYAKKVADFLGTIHHEFHFTEQEGIDCLEDLIYHLETYDVTTIRASTPMFLLSRKIKSMGIKMVLSGEGADEIYGGYLYFHNAPDCQEFHDECVTRVKNLHNFDCLRANKSTMAWGLEARVPFLDKSFMELSIPIDPNLKLSLRHTDLNSDNDKPKKIEKYILRKAFDVCGDCNTKYLPDEILWRQKEQFSDGVGYNWIDSLKDYVNNQITDEEFSKVKETYKCCNDIPKNKEELYYRKIFDRLFDNRESIVPRWIPKMNWEGVSYDPSGRAQKVHEQHQ